MLACLTPNVAKCLAPGARQRSRQNRTSHVFQGALGHGLTMPIRQHWQQFPARSRYGYGVCARASVSRAAGAATRPTTIVAGPPTIVATTWALTRVLTRGGNLWGPACLKFRHPPRKRVARPAPRRRRLPLSMLGD